MFAHPITFAIAVPNAVKLWHCYDIKSFSLYAPGSTSAQIPKSSRRR